MAPKRKAATAAKSQSASASKKKQTSTPKKTASPAKKTAGKKPAASQKSTASKTAAASTRSVAAASNNGAADEDYTKLTVAQLKAECTKRGLDTGGVKAALVKRLQDEAQNDDEEPPAKLQKQSTIQRALETMKASAIADVKSKKRNQHKVDQYCNIGNAEVVDDYSCMLNQTNIGFNNNKYYVIQVLKAGNNYYAFNRWGRVGEPGQQSTKGAFTDVNKAIKDFEQKFHDKTKNSWEDKDNFEPVKGKYTLLDMGGDDEDEAPQASKTVKRICDTGTLAAYRSCTLEITTQFLVKLIFDNDMFKEALIKLEIDVKKMPLGKLSKMQICKGFEVLDEIKRTLDVKAISAGIQKKLEEFSSNFYTVIPHDFGRQRPPVINTQELLRTKLDMLITLGDIEMAQDMLKQKDDEAPISDDGLPDHPLDANFKLLQCELNLVKVSDQEYKVIEKYLQATGGYRVKKLLNVWKMDRKGEAERAKPHEKIVNRKLLWHGTGVAVVAAILKSGLRIMPHSGGRVGKGIYFASENAKSAGYVQTSKNTGIMFLNEVFLGKEHHIARDDSRLVKPPPGYDSIVARGQVEPDPKFDTHLSLDGKKVVVPQGKPIPQPDYSHSSFSQSEYLVYQENQVRMRYLLQLQMDF